MSELASDGMTMMVVTHEMGFAAKLPTALSLWMKAGLKKVAARFFYWRSRRAG